MHDPSPRCLAPARRPPGSQIARAELFPAGLQNTELAGFRGGGPAAASERGRTATGADMDRPTSRGVRCF